MPLLPRSKQMDIFELYKLAGGGKTPDEIRYTDAAILRIATNLVVADSFGNTPLHYAASQGNLILAQALVSVGGINADRGINFTNNKGQIPLHAAAENGHSEVLWLLMASGADVNRRDIAGNAPIHFAAACQEPTRPIELLLKMNADASVSNNKGQIAYELAKGRASESILNRLANCSIAGQLKASQTKITQRLDNTQHDFIDLLAELKTAQERKDAAEIAQIQKQLATVTKVLEMQQIQLELLQSMYNSYVGHLKHLDAAMARLHSKEKIKENPALFAYVNAYANMLNGIYMAATLSGFVQIKYDGALGTAGGGAEIASNVGDVLSAIEGLADSIPAIGGTISIGFKCIKAILDHTAAVRGRERLQKLVDVTPSNPSEWYQIVEDVAIHIATIKSAEITDISEIPRVGLKGVMQFAWQEIKRFISTDPKQSAVQSCAAFDAMKGLEAIFEQTITRENLSEQLIKSACQNESSLTLAPFPNGKYRAWSIANDPRAALAAAFHETTDQKVKALTERVRALELQAQHQNAPVLKRRNSWHSISFVEHVSATADGQNASRLAQQ
jgi:hypothetical protein